ncbi:CDP-diacylglycerol--inositol 3-phosphatidyltransferase, variant 2 [Balamuthia mandrillaris]
MVSPVYFFVPNLIGYVRVALACIAFYVSFTDYKLFFVCYGLSEILDAIDGHAARAFGQSSKFGAVLDMVTDRCATTCLLMVLSFFYRDHILYFTAVVALDIASHYAHLYSSLARRLASHKAIDQTANPLLRIYYTNRAALGALCFGNEAFFLLLYVAHFESGLSLFFFNNQEMTLVRVLTMVVAPLMLAKQLMNVIQLKQAATDLAKLDEVEHYGKKQKFSPNHDVHS